MAEEIYDRKKKEENKDRNSKGRKSSGEFKKGHKSNLGKNWVGSCLL